MQGPGLSDGFRIDELGRMWSSCPNGLAVIDLGRRALLAKVNFNTNISNVEFGRGPDVWVTGLGHLSSAPCPSAARSARSPPPEARPFAARGGPATEGVARPRRLAGSLAGRGARLPRASSAPPPPTRERERGGGGGLSRLSFKAGAMFYCFVP
ncbi:unnamed protein product [Prorocentrum cordatum]|uniref:Gluconolactonase n=1 Tax=Prorocentrum cordatum TaxID=2364126 RepID=A0ABN9RFS2_9DINO|nr:unnamed protein product [Polarella glacialis]